MIEILREFDYVFYIFVAAIIVLVLYFLWDAGWMPIFNNRNPRESRKPSAKELMRRLDEKEKIIRSRDDEIQRLKAAIRQLQYSQRTHSRTYVTPTAPSSPRQPPMNEMGERTNDSGNPISTDYAHARHEVFNEEPQSTILCRLYNEGVHDANKRSEFRDKYRITRISTTNVDDRRRNPHLDAVFQTSNGGEFYVIEIQEHGGRVYVAVPHFDLEINDLSYVHGAAGEVFTCLGYQSGGSYRPARVVQPAHFKSESDSTWRLQHPGELEVTQK
jgi:hypothetical protein